MMKLDKKLKIKSAKISFLRIYIYRGGDLRDEDLFVHRLLSPLVAVFVCNHFPNGSCDMSQVAFAQYNNGLSLLGKAAGDY